MPNAKELEQCENTKKQASLLENEYREQQCCSSLKCFFLIGLGRDVLLARLFLQIDLQMLLSDLVID
jgi:hypothetical protein